MTTCGVAISLFAGAGGLDLDAERAGYEVRAAGGVGSRCSGHDGEETSLVSSRRLSNRDILTVSTAEILRGGRPEEAASGQSSCWAALHTPPILKSRASGLEWKREGLDPDASLLQAYTRVLAEAQPRRFVLENVYALTYNNKASRPAFERLMREIDAAGYHCRARVLNAADYGVPQSRPRLFIIGVPKGDPLPPHPMPTHGGQWERRLSGDPRQPHVTTGRALADLVTEPEAGAGRREDAGTWLPGARPASNYLFYTEKRGHPGRCCSSGAKSTGLSSSSSHPTDPPLPSRLSPAPTLAPSTGTTGAFGCRRSSDCSPTPTISISLAPRSSAQAQLGNSVPPLLAELVFRSFDS